MVHNQAHLLRLLLLGSLVVSTADGAQPWDAPFAKDTAAILDAARKVVRKENPHIVVLLEDHRIRIAASGTAEHITRRVYRIDHPEAVESWSSMEQEYRPWYQTRPTLRARVIQKNGSAHWLDEKTIADAPARELDSSVYSDSRTVRAPLPAVAAGSVVEVEITVRDKTPFLDAGVAWRVSIPDSLAVERFHVLIEADAKVPLRTLAKLVPATALREEKAAGLTRWECDWGPWEPRKSEDFEWNLPFDESPSPYLSFSTGASWQAIAARYETIVNQRIAQPDLKALLAGEDGKGSTLEVASRLAARLHKAARYTGVEFGEAAIVPATPDETLRRGYGDCKDKAVLLVAMLRALGRKATVALLSAGHTTDVDAALPGLGLFNHAIVYVDGDTPLWIDATASDVRVGTLPPPDQGRLALIASADTTALTRTPEGRPQDATSRQTYEILINDYGTADYHETLEISGGQYEQSMRSSYNGDERKIRERLETFVKKNFQARALGKVEVVPSDDFSRPFQFHIEAQQTKVAVAGLEQATARIAPSVVLERLPFGLRKSDDPTTPAAAGKKRKSDFVFPEAFQAEYIYRIVPPPLYQPGRLPESHEMKLGPATLRLQYEKKPAGVVEVTYSLNTGRRRWTAAEVEDFRDKLKSVPQSEEVFTFTPETSDLVAIGEIGKAIELARAHVVRNPAAAMPHARLAWLLLRSGFGGAARAEARKAVEIDPKLVVAWTVLGDTYVHDTLGRHMTGDWNPAEAERCFRKALELDPDDFASRLDLAILLEHDKDGLRYSRSARTGEAIEQYREGIKRQALPTYQQNLTVTLLRTGRLREAREEARKAPPAFAANLEPVFIALEEGGARAVVAAQSAVPDSRQRAQFLLSTAFSLLQMRLYDEARILMRAAARLDNRSELQARAGMLDKLQRWDRLLVKDDDPKWPVQQLLLHAMRRSLRADTLRELFASNISLQDSDSVIRSLDSEVAAGKAQMAQLGFDVEVGLDSVFSLLAMELDGEPSRGYRIKALISAGSSQSIYVVPENGKYRIIGFPPTGLEQIGLLVLDFAAKNELKAAQWWLDHVAAEVEPNADGTGRPSVHALWSGITEASRGLDAIRIAASSLIAAGTGAQAALDTLRQARAKAKLALDQAQLDKALCEGLARNRNWTELMTVGKRLEATKMFSEEGFRYLIRAAAGAKNWKELEVAAQKRLKQNDKNTAAMKALAIARLRLGDTPGALSMAEKVTSDMAASSEEYTFTAWMALLSGKADTAALDRLVKAKDLAAKASVYSYTLATMQAALRKTDEARATLLSALQHLDLSTLPASAWLAYGRISEQYGLSEEAAAAYARARRAAEKDPSLESNEWAVTLIPSPSTETRSP